MPHACAAAGKVFGHKAASLSLQTLPDQFQQLTNMASLMLKFLDPGSAYRQAVYSVHLEHFVGSTVFDMLSKQVDLYSRHDIAEYTQLLPASHNRPAAAAAASGNSDDSSPRATMAASASASLQGAGSASETATAEPSAPGPTLTQSSTSTSASAAASAVVAVSSSEPQQLDYDAVLTKLANSGLYTVPVQQLCQEQWPTPREESWGETQTMAAQLATVLFWMMSSVQKPKPISMHAKELWETVMELLHKLLLGHLTDMSLDMTDVFHTTFEAVTEAWQACDQSDFLYSDPQEQSALAFYKDTHLSQLGRAFLRRLAADVALSKRLFEHVDDETEDATQCNSAINGVISICRLMSEFDSGHSAHYCNA